MPSTPVRGDSGAPSRAPEHSGAPAHSTRRSLVRAAVWSAPVVAVALASPAAAASEVPPAPLPDQRTSDATLSFDTFVSWSAQWVGSTPTATVTQVQIQNQYWHASSVGAPVPVLSVRVCYPAAAHAGAAPTAVSGSGWRFVAAVPLADGSVDYVFTWSGPALEPGHSTPQLEYVVPVVASGLVGEASAPNADPVRR
jgi:hypothetical protein